MNKTFTMNNYIDICFFSIYKEKLCLLLTKRKNDPYKDTWALAGGIWENTLNPDEAASNLMLRKTGLTGIYLEQLKTYGGIGRDPRGASCSVAYIGLVNYDKLNKKIINSDKEELKWFPIEDIPRLAFDHNSIVLDANERIINKIRYTKVGFELVGNEFTIKELVDTFEKITSNKIDKSNLRKKLTEQLNIIEEVSTSKHEQKGRGRKSLVYKLNELNFKKMNINESFF
jgi:8-oxo-dGTP diphosphatase